MHTHMPAHIQYGPGPRARALGPGHGARGPGPGARGLSFLSYMYGMRKQTIYSPPLVRTRKPAGPHMVSSGLGGPEARAWGPGPVPGARGPGPFSSLIHTCMGCGSKSFIPHRWSAPGSRRGLISQCNWGGPIVKTFRFTLSWPPTPHLYFQGWGSGPGAPGPLGGVTALSIIKNDQPTIVPGPFASI